MFIKSVHGQISAGGIFFTEGIAIQVDDEQAKHEEIVDFIEKGYLKSFKTDTAAKNHTFRGISERLIAGVDVTKPETDSSAEADADKAKAEAELKAKEEAELKAKKEAEEAQAAEAQAKLDADAAEEARLAAEIEVEAKVKAEAKKADKANKN